MPDRRGTDPALRPAQRHGTAPSLSSAPLAHPSRRRSREVLPRRIMARIDPSKPGCHCRARRTIFPRRRTRFQSELSAEFVRNDRAHPRRASLARTPRLDGLTECGGRALGSAHAPAAVPAGAVLRARLGLELAHPYNPHACVPKPSLPTRSYQRAAARISASAWSMVTRPWICSFSSSSWDRLRSASPCTRSQGTHPQLVASQGPRFHWRRRGPEQQAESDHQKSVRVPHLSRNRDRPLPRPRRSTGSGRSNRPQILLRRQNSSSKRRPIRWTVGRSAFSNAMNVVSSTVLAFSIAAPSKARSSPSISSSDGADVVVT